MRIKRVIKKISKVFHYVLQIAGRVNYVFLNCVNVKWTRLHLNLKLAFAYSLFCADILYSTVYVSLYKFSGWWIGDFKLNRK